ncbi:MAG: hypothetical protein H7840_00455 [Alphaproteobacteria bacterium]
MGPQTLDALKILANGDETRQQLLDALAEWRLDATNNTEKDRIDHYRFTKTR